MKKTILLLLVFCVSTFSFSQGQITGVVIDPVSPTNADYVKVYVNLSFSSGGCEPDYAGSSTNGNTTTASALHCLGALTVICNTTDTFDLGYLQTGTHQFSFTLSSGYGGPGCSPGIVPDDDTTLSFTVSSGLGIDPIEENDIVQFFPNPMTSSAVIKLDPSVLSNDLKLILSDALGRTIRVISDIESPEILITRNDLSSGFYFFRLVQENKIISSGKFSVE